MCKKVIIEELQTYAINKHGKCLDTTYINSYTKMSWECEKGHQWEAVWNNIKNSNSWCPYCAGINKPDIIELQEYAKNKGGKLVSTKYINNNTKLLWECSKGHQWEAHWNSILTGKTWCPGCSLLKPNITELQEYAINKGGKLVSTEYINNITKMLWECSEGHQWKACWNSINSGSWCPECAGKAKPDISELQQFASSKQGKLISIKYINNNTKLLWECSEGHQWKARWNSILTGKKWCPYCAGKAKPNIIELQEYASSKQGKLISTKYINNKENIIWECSEGHQWEARWDSIKNAGHWCPECSSFKTEYKCKELLEQKLGFEFKKTRFYYDKNNKHKFFEFDGYNDKHKIAFEYHGYQHYIFPNFFQKTKEEHEKAVQRDLDKINYVKENNIKLIIIPYTEEKNLEDYITKQIDILNIGI